MRRLTDAEQADIIADQKQVEERMDKLAGIISNKVLWLLSKEDRIALMVQLDRAILVSDVLSHPAVTETEQTIRNAEGRGYPYGSDLRTGCRFYPDEAYEDGIDRSAKTPEEMHPNANGCDTCSDPAQFQTCPDTDEDVVLYICECCIDKFGLETLVDRE